MCFGGGKSNTVTPTPTPQTTFDYKAADTSNDAQRKAAINSTTQGTTMGSFGSELAASTPDNATANPVKGM